MATIIFSIILAVLATMIIIAFNRLSELESFYSELLNNLVQTQGELQEANNRLNAHFADISNNQKAIDEIKDKYLSVKKEQKDESINPLPDVANPAAEEQSEAPAAEDEPLNEASEEQPVRQVRQPYPPEVREMAEDFIKAEFGKSSYKTMSKLLNIPVSTVKRWTKQLIQKGVIAKQ